MVKVAKLSLGDYVLVAKVQEIFAGKLSLKWQGPFRVVEVMSDHLFKVESLKRIGNKSETKIVHSQRLKFFHDKSLELTEEVLRHVSQEKQLYEIESFLELRNNGASYDVKVKWLGFDDNESTWEPVENLFEDVPLRLHEFLKTKPEGSVIWEALSRR
jgi:hypothetical protein